MVRRVRQQLKDDPVCKWFVEVRNRIEKQGMVGPRGGRLDGPVRTDELMKNAPPFTKSAIVGDTWGRSYWVVELPDGTRETVFFKLPAEMGRVDMLIMDAPDDRSVADLLEHYLSILEGIVDDAEQRFGE